MSSSHRDALPRAVLAAYGAWWVALAVAGILGSGRLVASAERQPYGPTRDLLVAGARAVDGLGRRLGLDGAARAVERAVGRGGSAAAGAAGAAGAADAPGNVAGGPEATARPATVAALRTTGTATPRRATPVTPPASAAASATLRPRRVTPDDPLRVHVAGDSFAEPLGHQLATHAARDRLLSVGMDFRISSGLARPDYFDWPARIAETVAAPAPPEVIVFFLGANEDQNLRVDDGAVLVLGTPEWEAEYARRAGAIMDLVADAGIELVWVGMPEMRDDRMATALSGQTRAVTAAADARPGTTFLDIRPLFRGPDGGFAAFLPGPDGAPVKMRGDDGIHLTRPGTNLVAERVYDRLRRTWDLRTPTPSATPTATATASPTPTPTAARAPTARRTPGAAPSPTALSGAAP